MRPTTRRAPVLVVLAAVLLALAAACSSRGGDDAGSHAGEDELSSSLEAPVEDAPTTMERGYAADSAALSENAPDAAIEKKIIAKGNVSVESDDVADTVFDVQRIADEHAGEVTERQTTTNDDGDISTARLLLRIPVAEFDETFTELEDVADLQSSSTGKEDVTTKVIDTQVRIRAQRRSLLRVEALLDRAQSISDIIRIEAQLTSRQADLDSLQQRLDYLTNQTSMSTISVNISLPPKKDEDEEEPEEAGFLAGLEDGWNALKSFGTAMATLGGRLLPFAVVLLIVGGPVLLLVRRLRRRDPDLPTPTAPAGPPAG